MIAAGLMFYNLTPQVMLKPHQMISNLLDNSICFLFFSQWIKMSLKPICWSLHTMRCQCVLMLQQQPGTRSWKMEMNLWTWKYWWKQWKLVWIPTLAVLNLVSCKEGCLLGHMIFIHPSGITILVSAGFIFQVHVKFMSSTYDNEPGWSSNPTSERKQI